MNTIEVEVDLGTLFGMFGEDGLNEATVGILVEAGIPAVVTEDRRGLMAERGGLTCVVEGDTMTVRWEDVTTLH